MIPEQITNPKGCEHFLYEDDFTDNDDLFEHSVYCGTRLVRDNKLVLCDNCKNIQKAQAQVLLNEKKSELEFWEPYANFMDVSNEDNEKTAEIKNNLIIEGYDKIQELQEEIKVLEGVKGDLAK